MSGSDNLNGHTGKSPIYVVVDVCAARGLPAMDGGDVLCARLLNNCRTLTIQF